MTQKWTNWDINNPPVEGAVATERGWEIPLAGTNPEDGLTEVLVAIGELASKGGEGNIISVVFSAERLAAGEEFTVTVTFNEAINMEAGAELTVTAVAFDETPLTDITITAEEVENSNVAVFAGTAPAVMSFLNIANQTIAGTAVDAIDEEETDLEISETLAEAAGTAAVIVVGPAVITAVEFDQDTVEPGEEFTVTVTFNEPIMIEAGAELIVTAVDENSAPLTDIVAVAPVGEEVLTLVFTGTAPEVAATLSITAQTIDGTAEDLDGDDESNLEIGADEATAAGTLTVEVTP